MRLIRTQAKDTAVFLKKAENIMLTAIRTNNFNNLQLKLEQELKLMPAQALQIVRQLAEYEAQFTEKKLKQYAPKRDIVKLTEQQVGQVVQDITVKTSVTAAPLTIPAAYTKFVAAKTEQYVQIALDIQTEDMDEDEAEDLVKERTKGLFSTQNLALAGLVILGTANSMRNEVVRANLLEVEWVLDLELNNCPDCQDMADGGPYAPEDVDGLIPLHVNCGCSLVPILGDLDDVFE